ncbi:photosynthetic NDH subunit of subcomplex B 3, chloroplastic isoform X2 [Diospyros lotus]|uniref:photosynthetic NDH subunit of subcomplex B 3, chloroplastic isoform X2 n=1 Tax=Diospyros lotus TaxID=55363 RepID=UPI00224F3C0C|nr:photosynthetic NDH subunit of subcomplex B 3, chloroplastic isoform X2 [Diospyros lotus]
MASVHLHPPPLRPPEVSAGYRNCRRFVTFTSRKRGKSVSFAANSLESALEPAQIELEFIGPKAGGDGKFPVDRATAVSGEKLLRNIMLDNKIELYAAYIVNGKDLLNERTNTELRYLKKKPESWRLACQTIVGNKENSGKVVVQRLPQWKK